MQAGGLEGVLAGGMDEIAHVDILAWEIIEPDRNRQLSPEEWEPYLFQAALRKVDLSADDPLGSFLMGNASTLERIAGELKTARVSVCTTMLSARPLI